MAAVADAQDPRHFGGTAPSNNLVDPAARDRSARRAPTRDCSARRTRPSTARSARVSRSPRSRRRSVSPDRCRASTPAIAWLTKQQCANGLWQAYRAEHRRLACPAAEPDDVHRSRHEQHRAGGAGTRGVGQVPAAGHGAQLAAKRCSRATAASRSSRRRARPRIPNSTALVIQALVAESSVAGVGARGRRARRRRTPRCASYQLGCTSAGFGAFFFPGSTARERVRDRAVGSGDGRQEAAGRDVDRRRSCSRSRRADRRADR